MEEGLNSLALSSTSLAIICAVVVSYFILITAFGTYFSRFSRDVNDFFYSGQRFAWWIAAASMVATGIGSYSYLKYSEQGYITGMSSTLTYMNDWFIVPFFMFGWLPIIYFARVRSIPEYFERRFNKTARYIAVVTILSYMFFYIGYNFYTIGVAIEGLIGIPQIYTVPIVAVLLGAYVTMGGQTAVIFTDLFQGIMLYLAGGLAILAGIWALGGFDEWWGYLPVGHRLPFVHLTQDYKFNTAGLFWGEALAGSIAFTFMNQGFIMRYLAIKSVNDGRKAALFNVLVTLPLSAVIVGAVGWIAKSLIMKQTAMGGSLAGLNPIEIENTFHTFLIVCWETLHHNSLIFGFVIAALTAALMSTIDTLINACAAVGIYDIYKPLIKKEASDEHYLKAARWASIIATVIGLLLVVWFNGQSGSLMSIHYKGIMVIIPAIVTTIFLGAFWKRFNGKAACTAMTLGSILTLLSLKYPEWIDPMSRYVYGPTLEISKAGREFIYMRAMFGMTVTAIIGIFVTLVTKPQSEEKTKGLTVGSIDDAMIKYKGGKPNHSVGEKIGNLEILVDNTLKEGEISVSASIMKRLSADLGDMVYGEDTRWWLGGLRSYHFKMAPAHKEAENLVKISEKSMDLAYMLPKHRLKLEKIF